MKTTIIILTCCLLAVSSLDAVEYQIDNTHSATIFSVQHLGLGYSYGRFNTFSGTINFDEAALDQSSIHMEIDVASVDTDNKKRDDHLRNADFFDAGTHPKMTFTSTSIKAVDGKKDTYAVSGKLSIRGTSKDITVETKKVGQGIHAMTQTPAIGFETQFSIDRTEFGVGQGKVSQMLGKKVRITVALEAVVPKSDSKDE